VRRRLVITGVLLVAAVVAAGLAFRYYWLHRFDELIAQVAPLYQLDPLLVRAVIHTESHFDSRAASGAGAKGLMQITAPVVDEWRAERGYRILPDALEKRVTVGKLKDDQILADPAMNLHVGCWYLAKLVDRFHDEPDPMVVALAAYNAGPSHAERWLKACKSPPRAKAARVAEFVEAIDFPETKAYVESVRERYADAVASDR
jgi:soluble lytic murein transglycosylase